MALTARCNVKLFWNKNYAKINARLESIAIMLASKHITHLSPLISLRLISKLLVAAILTRKYPKK